MPQTREHLRSSSCSGCARLVALTKCDLVDDDARAGRADVEELLAGTALAGAPIVVSSARTGAGSTSCAPRSTRAAAAVEPRSADGRAAAAGRPRVHAARVRHGRHRHALVGRRCAPAIASGARGRRGAHPLAAGARRPVEGAAGRPRGRLPRRVERRGPARRRAYAGPALAAYRLDVALQAVPGGPGVGAGAHVEVLHGTTAVHARVVLLDGERCGRRRGAGAAAAGRPSPPCAATASRSHPAPPATVAGGTVLDPAAAPRRRPGALVRPTRWPGVPAESCSRRCGAPRARPRAAAARGLLDARRRRRRSPSWPPARSWSSAAGASCSARRATPRPRRRPAWRRRAAAPAGARRARGAVLPAGPGATRGWTPGGRRRPVRDGAAAGARRVAGSDRRPRRPTRSWARWASAVRAAAALALRRLRARRRRRVRSSPRWSARAASCASATGWRYPREAYDAAACVSRAAPRRQLTLAELRDATGSSRAGRRRCSSAWTPTASRAASATPGCCGARASRVAGLVRILPNPPGVPRSDLAQIRTTVRREGLDSAWKEGAAVARTLSHMRARRARAWRSCRRRRARR